MFAQAAAVPGDSGSLVISDDGCAVGVLVTVGVARAEQVLGIDLTLLTADPL